MLRIQLLLCTVLIISEAECQNQKSISENNQFWWSINTTARLKHRVGVMADFHVRRNDFIKETNFYFVRIGLVYWGSNKFSLAGGYAHLWLSKPISNENYTFQNENRIFQQAQWVQKSNKLTFVQRIRNEQRWNEVLNTDGDVLRVRFSDRIRFLWGINIKVFENQKLPSLSVADELHIQFGSEVVYNTFDQNRIFVGIKQRILKNLSFDVGYMMVYQQRYSGFEYDMNHTFRLFFYYTPDLRRKNISVNSEGH